MRRLFVVLTVLAALAVPMPPRAEAVTAGGCLVNGSLYYPYGVPLVPTPMPMHAQIVMNCFGYGTLYWVLEGEATSILSSCAAEATSIPVYDAIGAGYGYVMWIRVGSVGWMFADLWSPYTSSRHASQGPVVWVPNGDATCVLNQPSTAGIISAGLQMGG